MTEDFVSLTAVTSVLRKVLHVKQLLNAHICGKNEHQLVYTSQGTPPFPGLLSKMPTLNKLLCILELET